MRVFADPVTSFLPVHGETVQGEPASARSGQRLMGDGVDIADLRAVGSPPTCAIRKIDVMMFYGRVVFLT